GFVQRDNAVVTVRVTYSKRFCCAPPPGRDDKIVQSSFGSVWPALMSDRTSEKSYPLPVTSPRFFPSPCHKDRNRPSWSSNVVNQDGKTDPSANGELADAGDSV